MHKAATSDIFDCIETAIVKGEIDLQKQALFFSNGSCSVDTTR